MKINQNGFREYDARWLFEKDIDLEGITDLGKGLGTQIINHTKKTNPRVIVGHDYRSYSEKIKKALTEGLVSTGCNVEDVGLALSPMVYFAQFNLNSDAIAMVTASHNENGWTGVKMGIKKGLTHAPEEMSELKEITLNKKFTTGEGNLKNIDNFKKIYIEDLISKNKDNYDYGLCFLSMRLPDGGLHATLVIYDFKRNVIERFDPYGNTIDIDKDMDNVLRKELTINNKMDYYCPKVLLFLLYLILFYNIFDIFKDYNNEYILQVNGKLIHIKSGFDTNKNGFINSGVDIHNTEDEVIDFATRKGITEHTVLGAKIILKTLIYFF